jgi:hypothetical protein
MRAGFRQRTRAKEKPCAAAGVRIGMTRILGLVLSAILATNRFGPPEADTLHPISATDAAGQVERLIELAAPAANS